MFLFQILQYRRKSWGMNTELVGTYLKLGRRLGCVRREVGNSWETDSEQRWQGCWPGRTHSVLQYSTWMSYMCYIPSSLLFPSQIRKRTLSTHEYLRSKWQAFYYHYRSWNRLDLLPIFWIPMCWEELNRFLASHDNSIVLAPSGWKKAPMFDLFQRDVLKNSFIQEPINMIEYSIWFKKPNFHTHLRTKKKWFFWLQNVGSKHDKSLNKVVYGKVNISICIESK